MPFESELYKSLIDNFADGVYFVDRERTITYWNRGAERISGFTAEETVGSKCFDELLMHIDGAGTRLCHAGCPLAATIEDGEPREIEVFLHHKQGHRVPVLVRAAPIRDQVGTVIGALEVFSDNSPKMAALQRAHDLEKIAFLDPLTGLANRTFTEITLRARLEELVRYGWSFGVLFIDVDHFKEINDRHGHPVGDQALSIVANTLKAAARSFDLVGRWGGEEFVAVLVNVGDRKLDAIAERFLTLVGSSRLPIDGTHTRVTVSIGATLADPRDTVQELVARADALMYESKQAGRNRVTVGNRD
ncbi:MAG: sensor domain-containing diguanylate cyclase [Acidobacteria bacterium]|nr:sensor domain-containing diguanylate cyclase [Acidobacteriota bacterium]